MPELLVPEFIRRLHDRAAGWEELVHEEAEFSLLLFEGRTVRGRWSIARELNSGAAAWYRPRVLEVERLADNAVLVKGMGQYPLPGRGFGGGQVFWIDELRDGLVWRVRGFRSERAARAAWAETEAAGGDG